MSTGLQPAEKSERTFPKKVPNCFSLFWPLLVFLSARLIVGHGHWLNFCSYDLWARGSGERIVILRKRVKWWYTKICGQFCADGHHGCVFLAKRHPKQAWQPHAVDACHRSCVGKREAIQLSEFRPLSLLTVFSTLFLKTVKGKLTLFFCKTFLL